MKLPLICLSAIIIYGQTLSAFTTTAKSAILLDRLTNTVLFEKNADAVMTPSSMSKLMTCYGVFKKLGEKKLALDDTFLISEKAWRKGGSKMFVKVDTSVSVESLLRGAIVQSGNDACIALAEGMEGSEDRFASYLNRVAKDIGLSGKSYFSNATGWPDPKHLMTPRDLTILARRLIVDYPQYYHYFKEKEFTYNGIRQVNRNSLLFTMPHVDGLKTGHTEKGGYGLVFSANKNDMNLIGVVNGLKTAKERNQEARRLLDWGYREFISQQFYKKGDIVEEAPTWLGKKPTVPLVVDQDVAFVISKAPGQQPKISVQYKSPVVMPVHKGQKVGVLSIQIDGKTHQQPLYAGESVPRKGFLGRMSGAVKHILWGRKAAKKTPDDQNTQDQRTKDITVIKLPPKAES